MAETSKRAVRRRPGGALADTFRSIGDTLEAIGSLGAFGRRATVPVHSDAEALRADWDAVGNDLRSAMEALQRDQHT